MYPDRAGAVLNARGAGIIQILVDTYPGKAATCTETGLTEGKHCSVCGVTLMGQNVVPAKGHDWGEWTVSIPATPEAEGEEIRTCSRCEEEETRPLPYTGDRQKGHPDDHLHQ